jgi:hypothetical protein
MLSDLNTRRSWKEWLSRKRDTCSTYSFRAVETNTGGFFLAVRRRVAARGRAGTRGCPELTSRLGSVNTSEAKRALARKFHLCRRRLQSRSRKRGVAAPRRKALDDQPSPRQNQRGGPSGPPLVRVGSTPSYSVVFVPDWLLNYRFGPIAFPCDKTTPGPGARCGSGQETQILGRQGHPHQSCRAWLHHAGDVQDARVLLSRRAGRCLLLRTGH